MTEHDGLYGILGAVAAFTIHKLIDYYEKRADKGVEKTESNAKEITALTLSMTELKIELRFLRDDLKVLPEVVKDLNGLHLRVRNMEQKKEVSQ